MRIDIIDAFKAAIGDEPYWVDVLQEDVNEKEKQFKVFVSHRNPGIRLYGHQMLLAAELKDLVAYEEVLRDIAQLVVAQYTQELDASAEKLLKEI